MRRALPTLEQHAPMVANLYTDLFINDRLPRATNAQGAPKGADDWTCEPTVIGRRAAIGSNATILCGVTVGDHAMVGAGSVVTRAYQPGGSDSASWAEMPAPLGLIPFTRRFGL